jgi:hypothetical protein
LYLGVRASGTLGKLLLTTNDLAFQDGNIATIRKLLGYLNCERDSYIIHLTLRVEEDNPTKSYDDESLVPTLKRRGTKENPKGIQTPLIKKEQKGPAQKKIKKEVNIEVSLYNIAPY